MLSRLTPHDPAHISRIEEEVLQNLPRTARRSDSCLTQRSPTAGEITQTRKAPGLDGISNKAIKCFPQQLLSLLVAILTCLQNCYFPPAWKGRSDHLLGKVLSLMNSSVFARPLLSTASPPRSRIYFGGFKIKTVAVFFDVAKAFDRVWYAEQESLRPLSPAVLRIHQRHTAPTSGVQLALFADDTALYYKVEIEPLPTIRRLQSH
ncbi:hypothetical protein EVAR_58236_1 [Eumeta japonica]|uniref:Uncharacterized protein n=1 Tax=Eumeta variegata TaxID=151549 RepID=A0A4C2AE48_EUMVA|nr:hypothetical protein EVAR_58236_1 [Eumeta japonica]